MEKYQSTKARNLKEKMNFKVKKKTIAEKSNQSNKGM